MELIKRILPAPIRRILSAIRNQFLLLINKMGFGILLFYGRDSYLNATGWNISSLKQSVVDANGQPCLWLSYPFVSFVSERITPGMTLFEYGSGNSTLWWSKRVHHVYTCEHNKFWYERMSKIIPTNVSLSYKGLGVGYVEAILEFRDKFDVIVIDGRERVQCAYNSVGALKPNGVIIWDNSERERYRPGLDYLKSCGFKRIDFVGLSALGTNISTTSMFYKQDNCFGI